MKNILTIGKSRQAFENLKILIMKELIKLLMIILNSFKKIKKK